MKISFINGKVYDDAITPIILVVSLIGIFAGPWPHVATEQPSYVSP